MPKLTNFTYCSAVEKDKAQNGMINSLGIFEILSPDYVPGALSFGIVFSIVGVDYSKNNVIKVIFKKVDSDKSIIDTKEITLPSPPNKNVDIPDDYKGFNMCLDFRNVVFKENGLYVTHIYFNGELLSAKEIYVKGRN